MNPDQPLPPKLPSFRTIRLASLIPFAVAALIILSVGIHLVTGVVVLAAVVVTIAAAGTFALTLHIAPDRSVWRATFGLMLDRAHPKWLQHWYVPLASAALAGAVAETARAVLAGGDLSWSVVGGTVLVGVLDGVVIALALALGFGLSSWLLYRRAA